LGLFGALTLPGIARAQAGGPLWISLDRQPAGTPAAVILNRDLSGPSQTYFDVFISGFYVTTRVGADGRTYQDLSVPGLPSHGAPGEPRVPIVRADLGIVTNATAATLTAATALDLRSLPGYLVWPSPIPAQIHEGTPSQFVRDDTTYASAVDFPRGDGAGGETRLTLGGIPASLCTAYPVHWNPTSGVLSVAAHARFGFSHGGALNAPMELTIKHADASSMGLLNWDTINSQYTVNWNQFKGAFLFVCPSTWLSYLQQLIQEKKTRGFAVTVVGVPLTGETCSQLQQTIQNWYAATPVSFDHYCLLVGSTGSTPYCFKQSNSNSQLTDKVLSSVDGDLEPEIYLGRLWVASTAELQNQVNKILDYETGSQVNNDGTVLLVAHHEQSQDFNFESYQEGVRKPYTQVTPTFITCYGTNPALGNADIENDINNGVGLVAYSGHGDSLSWLQWSYSGTSFTNSDASALSNGALTPVVWSLACDTGNPRGLQSLASGFMKKNQGGSVAFYGAVDPYGLTVPDVLNDSLFEAVYGEGITTHGLAIALAEHAVTVVDPSFGFDAVAKFLLYGDPEMEIKRHSPSGIWAPIDLLVPVNVVGPCPGTECCPSCPAPIVDIQARDSGGAPVPGVKIGLWKPNSTGGDELLDNGYTGPDGWVHIPAPMITAGTLYVGFDDGDGRAGNDSINVQPSVTGVADEGLRALPLRLVALPNVTAGTTRFAFGRGLDSPARVSVFGVDGRLVRVLTVPAGAASIAWDGRDRRGRLAATGLYLARLDARAARITTRVVIAR